MGVGQTSVTVETPSLSTLGLVATPLSPFYYALQWHRGLSSSGHTSSLSSSFRSSLSSSSRLSYRSPSQISLSPSITVTLLLLLSPFAAGDAFSVRMIQAERGVVVLVGHTALCPTCVDTGSVSIAISLSHLAQVALLQHGQHRWPQGQLEVLSCQGKLQPLSLLPSAHSQDFLEPLLRAAWDLGVQGPLREGVLCPMWQDQLGEGA